MYFEALYIKPMIDNSHEHCLVLFVCENYLPVNWGLKLFAWENTQLLSLLLFVINHELFSVKLLTPG